MTDYTLSAGQPASSTDLTLWSVLFSPIVTTTTVEDDWNARQENVNLPNLPIDGTRSVTITGTVAQDAVGRATRFPTFRLFFSGSTSEFSTVDLDTNTGELNLPVGNQSIVTAYVIDTGSDWVVTITAQSTDSSNTLLALQVYPAWGASETWVTSGSAVGTITLTKTTFSFYGEVNILGSDIVFGSGFYIPAIPGAVAIAGTIASLLHNRKLSADAGSVSITGTPADIYKGFTLNVDAGSILINGTTADLYKGFTLSANAGSVSIVGTAADLNKNYVLSADAGLVVLTGTPAELRRGYSIAAESSSFLIDGTAASLKRSYQLAANSGSVLITGTIAILLLAVHLAAAAGSFLITGTEADLIKSNPILAADPGLVSINGTAATLAKDYRLPADDGVVGRETVTTPFGGAQNNSTSVDCGTNADRFLVVNVSLFDNTASIDTITFDGVAMTVIESRVDAATNTSVIYGLVDPPTGSSTLVVNFSSAPNEGPVITAMPFYTVVQDSVAAAIRDSAFADTSGAPPAGDITATLTGVQPNDMTVAGAYHFKSTPDGVTYSTLTEQSDAVFTGSGGTCEGATASDLGVSTVTIDQTSSACILVTAALISNGVAPSVLITGTDATLTKSTEDPVLPANSGSVLITGTDASLEQKYQIPADSGSVTINGTAADLEIGYVISAASDSVLITGTDVDFRLNSVIAADSGTVLVTGTPVTFKIGSQSWKPQDKAINQWSNIDENSNNWSNMDISSNQWSNINASSNDWSNQSIVALGDDRYSELTTQTYDNTQSTYDSILWTEQPKEVN